MANPDVKKKKRQTRIAGAAFSCALAAVCIALFLFSDSGAALLASMGVSDTVYEPSPAPVSEEADTSGYANPAGETEEPFDTEAFWELAGRLGAPAPVSEHSAADGRARIYTIENGQGASATLTLSLQNGAVTAFTLQMDVPEAPEPLPSDAGPLMAMAHAQQAKYEASLAWYPEVFAAYCLALDHTESLAYAEVALIEDALRAAIGERAACTKEAGDYMLDAVFTSEGEYAATFRAKS